MIEFIAYAILNSDSKVLSSGVVNETSDHIQVSIPEFDLFLECNVYKAKDACERAGLTFIMSSRTVELNNTIVQGPIVTINKVLRDARDATKNQKGLRLASAMVSQLYVVGIHDNHLFLKPTKGFLAVVMRKYEGKILKVIQTKTPQITKISIIDA